MPHLPRVPAFPIAGEKSILTAAGAALKISAKEKDSPLIGHFAPEIVAQDHLDREVSLHATIALGRPIILYFFPLAGSPHCTKESCSFRDAVGTSPVFNDLNAVVIGISQDPPSRSRRFVDEHHLGFRILHDMNRNIMNTWGVGRGLLGLIDGRCTFVIDHEGVVRAMLDGVWDYQGHRDFAEKWLTRIEHELSGRERFYMEYEADDSVACDESTRNVKVVYGSPVPSRGIASSPRYGAAAAAPKKKNKNKSSSKTTQQSKAPLSIAAEANTSGPLPRQKSRRNFATWLRPNTLSDNTAYDEPLHVDYKLTNRSLDNVTSQRQRRNRHLDPARATSSTDKVAARVRSLRLEESIDSSAGHQRELDLRSPHSREGSGSGSGWATPSTISARSVSTGETSHTSPAPNSRDSAHAMTLAAAIKDGIVAKQSELERSGSSRRRGASDAAVNRVNVTANSNLIPALPTARSSSLSRREGSGDAEELQASSDSRLTVSHHNDEPKSATVYANGNIARMPLLPSANLERSMDSMATVLDRRARSGHISNDSSADSTYAANASSLPVPPRKSARNGPGAAAYKVQRKPVDSMRPRSPEAIASSDIEHGTPLRAAAGAVRAASATSRNNEDDDEDGYATDRVASSTADGAASSSRMRSSLSGNGLDSRQKIRPSMDGSSPPRHSTNSRSPTPSSAGRGSRRPLPPQSPVPSYAPPHAPASPTAYTTPSSSVAPSPSASPAPSFINWNSPLSAPSASLRALRAANGHPSPSASFSNNMFGIEGLDAHPNKTSMSIMERRSSNTPSLAPSTLSAFGGVGVAGHAASEYEYSPSIADSTHTFGGLED